MNWKPISEAPKDGRYSIVACFGRSSELKWVKHSRWMNTEEMAEMWGGDSEDYEGGWTDGDQEDDSCYPTHYMPLPEPPK